MEEELEKAQFWVTDLSDKCEEKDALIEVIKDKESLYEKKIDEF